MGDCMDLTYSELVTIPTFEGRLRYLMRSGIVSEETFGGHRWVNQKYYASPEWKRTRDLVIIRDGGCDLGVPGHDIFGSIFIHHLNPITLDDIVNRSKNLFDLENLVTVSFDTHQTIHYKRDIFVQKERMLGDTKLW